LRHVQQLPDADDGDHRLLEQGIEQFRRTARSAALPDAHEVALAQFEDRHRGVSSRLRRLGHALQEEDQPRLPRPVVPDCLEGRVVLLTVLLEPEAEIEERAPQEAPLVQEERDEEPTDTTVAVEERVDGLELRMEHAALDELRGVGFGDHVATDQEK
jgi:hypothetical protein